jgi:hypothetical protein
MGSSVTESVLREFKNPGVDYPFTNKKLLIEAWALDAKPFPGKRYLIGQDFGLTDPVKSPADALFSRGFIKLGDRVMPLMLSGSGWTQAVYSVFHNHFMAKAAPGDQLLALGDDMNLLTSSSTEELFKPYIKVKSTDAALNNKKVLGLFTSFSVQPDPFGDQDALVGIVPRVIKTVSSASKRGSDWGENLSNLAPTGQLELSHSEATEISIKADLPVLRPYIQWKGKRKDLKPFLDNQWMYIDPIKWAAMIRHSDDWEYRIKPQEEMVADD